MEITKVNYPNIGSKHISKYLDSIKNISRLSLNLCNNRLANNHIQTIITQLLDNNNKVLELFLDSNDIADLDIILLRLLDNKIQKISIRSNDIAYIHFPINASLVYLDLYNNSLGDAGCLTLVRALERAYGLEYLDIGLNEIGIEGVKAIGSCVYEKPGIKVLKMAGNNIKQTGLCELLDRLCCGSNSNIRNTTLQYLDVSNNNFGNECAEKIYLFVHRCIGLLEMNISSNGIKCSFNLNIRCNVINDYVFYKEDYKLNSGFGETYI